MGVYMHRPLHFSDDHFAAGLAVIVVAYFWWKNTQGMHESSQKALQIMVITRYGGDAAHLVHHHGFCAHPLFNAPYPLHPGVVP